TERPTPPRRLSRRRKETSVTPAIGERINGGFISRFRILKGLTATTKADRTLKRLRFLFLVVALFSALRGNRRSELQQRRDAVLVLVRDLDERFVTQVLQIGLALFWLLLRQHRFTDAIVVERGRRTCRRPRVDAQNLITLGNFDRLGHAAGRNVLQRSHQVFAQA